MEDAAVRTSHIVRAGETFRTEVALATLEGEAERNTGWLFMEIFIERFSFLRKFSVVK